VYDSQKTRAELDVDGGEVSTASYEDFTRLQQRHAQLEELLQESLAALEMTSSSLQGWMEIADEGDERDYDASAMEAANGAIGKIREVLGLPDGDEVPLNAPGARGG
jgi:hypothetical protein